MWEREEEDRLNGKRVNIEREKEKSWGKMGKEKGEEN